MPNGEPTTALESITRRRFLLTGWPWRSLAYLLTTPLVLAGALPPLLLLALPWLTLLDPPAGAGHPDPFRTALTVLGGAVLLGVFGPLVALPLAAVERRRLRLVDTRRVASGHRRPAAPGPVPWLRARVTEGATWRELGYAVLLVGVVPLGYLVALTVVLVTGVLVTSPVLVGATGGPASLGVGQVETVRQSVPYALVGLLLLPTVPYLLALLAGAHAALARSLLGGDRPDEQLRTELVEVSRSRARLVAAFEAERRRIERDLHDGAQQRLVSLTLQLGLARLDLPPDSSAARTVAGAHEQAKRLMTELRQLIHGIHPQLLTDSGLPAALEELADRAPLPVTVRATLPDRPPPHVEATAYFVVAEALTNVARHSGAVRASVTASAPADTLVIEVADDGRGGADPGRGSGLTGLADRVAVVDGRMALSSPPGGPTLLRVELPCRHRIDEP